jgi:hypothetical protein
MPQETQPWARYCLFKIESDGRTHYLVGGGETNSKKRSVLDCDTAAVLILTAEKVRNVSFAVVLGVDKFRGKRAKSGKGLPIEVSVNIYGPRNSMSEVDEALSKIGTYRTYLQHPVFLEPGIPYINPQFFYPTSQKTDLRHLVGSSSQESGTKSKISQEVEDVMESLDGWSEDITAARSRIDDLQQILDQFLLTTRLKEYAIQQSRLFTVVTMRLILGTNRHQLKGVEFILGREDDEVATQMHRHMLMSIHHRYSFLLSS